jgi:hypothetical protein
VDMIALEKTKQDMLNPVKSNIVKSCSIPVNNI